MATPEGEETVSAPPTTESVVKSAEGEKEAPKAEEPVKTEEPKTEEPPAATEETTPETPAEETTEPAAEAFKEESNVVGDLKDTEKKALEELKARIVKAIEDKEFKVPKKVVEPPKEPETTEKPKEGEAPAAETTTEAPPATGEAPATEIPKEGEAPAPTPAEVPSETSKVTPPAESSIEKPEEKTEEKLEEKPKEEKPKEEKIEEKPKEEKPEETPKETVVEEKKEDTPATTEPEAPAAETPGTEETPVVETESKETPALEEEEEEDLTPPEDVSLWGVPLLHTKKDERTDVILLKFLRARDFNVAKAFEQLKNAVIWRKTFKVEGILDEDLGGDLDGVSYNYGKDKLGHPVCYNLYSPFQKKELYAKSFGDSTKLAAFIRWRIQVLEKGIKLLNFTPEGPSSMVQIIDLKGFTAGPFTKKKELKKAYNQTVNLLQDNYPELVVKTVFVNMPWYWNVLSAFVSLLSAPFVSARTRSKFVFLTPASTTSGLLKIISAEDVPLSYGGLSRAEDAEFSGVEAPGFEQVIKPNEKATIEIPITESSGTVLWDISVVSFEVSYGAEFIPSNDSSYTIVIDKSKKLAASTEEPVRTSFKFSEPGKVVLTIDNGSRKKKTAIYRYTIKASSADTEAAG